MISEDKIQRNYDDDGEVIEETASPSNFSAKTISELKLQQSLVHKAIECDLVMQRSLKFKIGN